MFRLVLQASCCGVPVRTYTVCQADLHHAYLHAYTLQLSVACMALCQDCYKFGVIWQACRLQNLLLSKEQSENLVLRPANMC